MSGLIVLNPADLGGSQGQPAPRLEDNGSGPVDLQAWVDLIERLIWQDPVDHEALRREQACGGAWVRQGLTNLPSDESLARLIKYDHWRDFAFEELFVNRYAQLLYRWFGHWGQSADLAEDLTQQIFCNFLGSHLEQFNPIQSFRAYLYTAAYNLFRDHLRRAGCLLFARSVTEVLSPTSTPEQVAVAEELQEQVRQATQRLPAGEREVFQASLDDLPPREIARRLGLEVKQVYAFLFSARRRIEEALDLTSQKRVYRHSQSLGHSGNT